MDSPVYCWKPIVIQYSSNMFEPADGFVVINCNLNHHFLGVGVAQRFYGIQPTDEAGKFHFNIRNVFTFPAHPGLN